MSAGYTRYLASGKVPLRQGNQNTNLAPAGAFQAGDGRYLSLAVLRNEHWLKFCKAMGLEHLTEDARFATNALRVEHRAVLDEIIVPLFASQPADYWLERLRAADILCGPINTIADIASDPNLAQTLPLADAMAATVQQAVGVPIRRDGRYGATYRPAPAKGQHTREILAEFGFSTEECGQFLHSGAAFVAKA